MSEGKLDIAGSRHSAFPPLDITTARRGGHLRTHPTAQEDPQLPTRAILTPLDSYDVRELWTRLYQGILRHSPFPCRFCDNAATQTCRSALYRRIRPGATATRNFTASTLR